MASEELLGRFGEQSYQRLHLLFCPLSAGDSGRYNNRAVVCAVPSAYCHVERSRDISGYCPLPNNLASQLSNTRAIRHLRLTQ